MRTELNPVRQSSIRSKTLEGKAGFRRGRETRAPFSSSDVIDSRGGSRPANRRCCYQHSVDVMLLAVRATPEAVRAAAECTVQKAAFACETHSVDPSSELFIAAAPKIS